MPLHVVKLEELKDLDGGRVTEAFAQAVRRAVADCEDRPGETKARTVTLQLEMEPLQDEVGHCASIVAAFQIKDNLPTRKSKKYSFGIRRDSRGSQLVFSDEDPSNVDQMMFGDIQDAAGTTSRKVVDEKLSAVKEATDQ